MDRDPITETLAAFMDRALAATGKDHFETPHDPAWPSPCELRIVDGISHWRPVPQNPAVDFSGLANALEIPVHPAIRAYYGSFWADNLEAETTEGPVSLIQLWSPADFDRLIENLLGHALAKRRSKQTFTAFFATTEEDVDLFLSIDNESGKVLLEEPGRSPLKVVDDNIVDFLERLSPRKHPPDTDTDLDTE